MSFTTFLSLLISPLSITMSSVMPNVLCRVSLNMLRSKPTVPNRSLDVVTNVSKSLMRHSTSLLLTAEPKQESTFYTLSC